MTIPQNHSLLLEDERHLEELASDATEGPWVRWEGHSRVLCGNDGENTPSAIRGHGIAECDPGDLPDIKCNGELVEDNTVYEEQAEFNAEFIAAARLGIPLLLSRLKAEREKVRQNMRYAQHSDRCQAKCGIGPECICGLKQLREAIAAAKEIHDTEPH